MGPKVQTLKFLTFFRLIILLETEACVKQGKLIQDILDSTEAGDTNAVGDIYLNPILNEFITINGTLSIPRIPVKVMTYDMTKDIINVLSDYIPGFLYEHAFLEQKKPEGDPYSLHFLRTIKELCGYLGPGIFNISLDLYQFIFYDYFTACMNVLSPAAAELAGAPSGYIG
jgi:hypothetical protein